MTGWFYGMHPLAAEVLVKEHCGFFMSMPCLFEGRLES
jgi:hypothetical protein